MCPDSGVFRTRGSPGEATGGERFGMNSGTRECLEKALGNLDTCYHRDRDQILTTTLVISSEPHLTLVTLQIIMHQQD